MSLKDFKSVWAEKVAGPQKGTNLPSTSLTITPPLSNVSSMYTFITATYRDIQSYISGLHEDLQLIKTINQYKKGCKNVYTKALESYSTCYQLAQNIVRTMDMFKELCTCLPDLEEYNYRLCEIMSIFIACELRLSASASHQEQLLIAQRIIYIMRKHLVQEEEHETSLNILRTLVYIPKLFNARDIMCAIFGEFIPIKPVPEVNVLPDKIYMLYIVVFYRWMMMQKDDDDKQLIVNFAESFMKPSVSLCSNNLYGAYLPMYTKHSTATRTILSNLTYYGNVRNASIIDNALKKVGAVVNLCDDDDDDIILVETSSSKNFAQTYASIRLEPLSFCVSNINLEEKTVVDTVDLTAENESLNSKTSINTIHDKWLNDFQNLAKQYQESKLILEKQQNKHVSNGEKQAIICLDSDSEEESEEILTVEGKETSDVEINKKKGNLKDANERNKLEDLFIDNYPLTNTPINCYSDLESLSADDENDSTQISPRFMPNHLRTYEAKKTNLLKSDKKKNLGANEQNKLTEIDKAYRRDSIHISSTPPEEQDEEEGESTDVQDENDEEHSYTVLHTKTPEIEVFSHQIRPMGPYPTYNSVHNNKDVCSQSLPRYSQINHNQEKQYYHSDNSEVKTPKKQKKRVQFNKTPLGPTVLSEPKTIPLKPALQQTKYKASDAPDYHLRGFERFSCGHGVEDSMSTSSTTKQQDHFEAAAVFFRQTYPPPISTSRSSVSSRSLISPNKAASRFNYEESSDEFNDVVSDSDIFTNERYRNDVKLQKRCKVVITPTKEMLQYKRKQNQMYNEILKEQRRKLELRALEKQKEKERRRRHEIKEQNIFNKETATIEHDKTVKNCRRTRNYDIFMSSESEYKTAFQVRTRNIKDLEPLKIQIEATETTTTALLSQIDAHLDKPEFVQSYSFEMNNKQEENQAAVNDSNQQPCDISTDKNNTKMRELNLLADIAQHLSPYQLDLPENNPPKPASPCSELSSINNDALQNACSTEVPKEKIIVTEQLFLQSIDSNKPQQQASSSYDHEPKPNKTAIFKSSSSTKLPQIEIQNSTQLEKKINNIQKEKQTLKTQTDETLEQILEESISVLTVTSPYNLPKEREVLQKNSTIPIIISSVESLNQISKNDDIVRQKVEAKLHLLAESDTNSKNVELGENLNSQKIDKSCNAKDVIEYDNVINKSTADLSSSVLNDVRSSVMCEADLINIPTERHVSQTLRIPPITAADLSDVSLESEISNNLPEIADTSPIVTDMSDNSNDSNVSHSFNDHILSINRYALGTAQTIEKSFPNLSVIQPNINLSSTNETTLQQVCLETNFNHFNSTLNTPIKKGAEFSKETDIVNCSSTDLNTPLKFAVQPEFEANSTSIKNGLEPEAVTTFLDLILNKTVTDAESDTRDKIIKELKALTEDDMVVSNNSAIIHSESVSEKPIEANNSENKKTIKEIDLMQTSLCTDNSKSNESAALTEHQLHASSANIDISPAKSNLKEGRREMLHDIKATELSEILHTNSLSNSNKISHSIKQTFNIKCSVRLKRLNINDHFNTTQMESLPPLPITKPVELQNSNINLTKCDSATDKPSKIKKTCLKTNKLACKELNKTTGSTTATEVTPNKKPKYDSEKSLPTESFQTPLAQTSVPQSLAQVIRASDTLIKNTTTAKPKSKPSKTVTFDLSNLNEELRDNTTYHKQKTKMHTAGIAAGALGCFLKSPRSSRKLPDNTLRAAETLQMFVNTINASIRTSPPAEFNKKRNPIKNKCIAEDETPRPPPASILMGTPPCKKSCIEKSRSHLASKCKDQLVSSLTSSAIPSITSDITTARIYTSSPLDQTLPEYDDNVDAVADSELILPSTTGSLRRKLKRPKKSLSRPAPTDDVNTDDIGNQPECNVEDDTDAVVDNEDDVFAEELLPIPAANEHILEEIVSARPTHIGASTGMRDDYINIEATATVPVYLFNDESRELGSPEVIQSSDCTNVVDSSSYLNTSTTVPSNLAQTSASTNSALGNLEKSMLSPSEHEVSSTQETFYQTPTKNKQTEIFVEKSSTSKEKGNGNSVLTANTILNQKSEDNKLKNTEASQTSSAVGLLQNNQVDTTNHSPEMCTVALTSTTTKTILANNRKIRKTPTHDEMLFNVLQQQLPSNKRKSNSATFCVESTSDNSNTNSKSKALANNLDIKLNRSLSKVDDKFKNLCKEVSKIDNEQATSEGGLESAGNNIEGGTGGSSPSTTTIINEECLSRSKRKKLKSSKSKKNKNRSERSSKISLKPSKLTPHTSTKPLIITISKSRLLRPPTSLPTPIESQYDQQQSEFLNIPNANLFTEKIKETSVTATSVESPNQISSIKMKLTNAIPVIVKKSYSSENPKETANASSKIPEINTPQVTQNAKSTPSPKEYKGSNSQTLKNKETLKPTYDPIISNTICTKRGNNFIFAKDKYDLIKSKDKHHPQNHDQDHIDKSKEKGNSQLASNSSRSYKSSTKEKIKGEKSKDKHKKTAQKCVSNQPPQDNVLKITISQNNIKSTLSSSAILPSTTIPLNLSNNNENNSKSIKTNSPSSSAITPSAAKLKSKTNSSTTNFSAATAATSGPSQITATALSTNNVRKKLKIK